MNFWLVAGRLSAFCRRAGLIGMQHKYKNCKRSDKMQTYLEQAFGKSDCSSVKMRGAVREWMDLYYGASRSGEDGSARLAVLIVSRCV